MPVIDDEMIARVESESLRRLQAIDSLLPSQLAASSGCGARFTADGGVAVCEHKESVPGTLDRTWSGAERRFVLTVSATGPDCDRAADDLLGQWSDHLAGVTQAGEADTTAVVTWPSRDVGGVNALMRHGLAPRAVIAARLCSKHRQSGQVSQAAWPAGITIRQAQPADLAVITSMGMGLIRYDALFGAVIERPESAQVLGQEIAGMLAGDDPWAWLAEREGTPVGMLTAEKPAQASWIAPMTSAAPVAYLLMMFVAPGERGAGIGAALSAEFHRVAQAAGVPLILLHYAQVNPLSAPFWSQQGYRPLWTVWEARPAITLR